MDIKYVIDNDDLNSAWWTIDRKHPAITAPPTKTDKPKGIRPVFDIKKTLSD
jgi:hypothetical protein